MASIHGLKRRITAAQNVSKTTRAMQMIAASKLKKAQEATLASRPYVDKLVSVTRRVASRLPKEFTHPYITPKTVKGKKLLLVFAPDKGLCGGLITNLLREFLRYQRQMSATVVTVGKKVESTVANLRSEVVAAFVFGTTTPSFNMVYPITKIINEQYMSGDVSSVEVLSTHFTSIFSQKPTITTILPVELTLEEQEKGEKEEYAFEPDAKELMEPLLNHYIEMVVYQKLLESFVSEQAARMVAMQNATSNAKDVIEDLRLEYNKTRQARITNEILDISGASAAMEIYE